MVWILNQRNPNKLLELLVNVPVNDIGWYTDVIRPIYDERHIDLDWIGMFRSDYLRCVVIGCKKCVYSQRNFGENIRAVRIWSVSYRYDFKRGNILTINTRKRITLKTYTFPNFAMCSTIFETQYRKVPIMSSFAVFHKSKLIIFILIIFVIC